MLDIKTTEAMRHSGISFAAHISSVGGYENILLDSAQDVAAFLADRDQFAADYYGVTKDVYFEWLRLDGVARCGGTTAEGSRCQNYLSGFGQLPIKEWLKRDGGYCAVHGGEGSEEARARGFGYER